MRWSERKLFSTPYFQFSFPVLLPCPTEVESVFIYPRRPFWCSVVRYDHLVPNRITEHPNTVFWNKLKLTRRGGNKSKKTRCLEYEPFFKRRKTNNLNNLIILLVGRLKRRKTTNLNNKIILLVGQEISNQRNNFWPNAIWKNIHLDTSVQ